MARSPRFRSPRYLAQAHFSVLRQTSVLKKVSLFDPPDPGASAFLLDNIAFLPLTVPDAIVNLTTDIKDLGLPNGTTTSLTAKLKTANAGLANGNIAVACQALEDFINETNAQSGKKIPEAAAAQLVSAAMDLQQELNCP